MSNDHKNALASHSSTRAAAHRAGPAGIARPAATHQATGTVVQRVINLNGGLVFPNDYQQFVSTVERAFHLKGYTWTPAHASLLTSWLQDHDRIIMAGSIEIVADNLFLHGDNQAAWQHMQRNAIPPQDLTNAQNRRKRQRAASLLQPSSVQTAKTAKGLNKLKDAHLLRLTQRGKEEDEHWVRRADKSLSVAKKRKLTKDQEARIIAAGDANDPSYVVWKGNRQLGHRYKGSAKPVNHSKKRTYGSKKNREGYEYKGSGLVDGHSVQAQDDQLILAPRRAEAPHWTTTPKTTGTSETYDDAQYLPKDEKEKKFIELHPYNFYWENQEQGKHFRQKGIEARALKNKTSFLHLNEYSGHTFHPNTGDKQQNSYDVPGRIDYLVGDTKGGESHLVVDNRPEADYSKPAQYNTTKNTYPDVKGAPAHHKNKSLGNKSVDFHLDLARQKDTSQFPFATVLHPRDPQFSYAPESRYEEDGYKSPPPSPFYISNALEEQQVVVPEDRTELLDFEYNHQLVEKAKYDAPKKQTELTLSSHKKASDPSSWQLPKPGTSTAKGAAIPATPGAGYLPTLQQDQALAAQHLTLQWVIPDGYCIFGAWGASINQSAAAVQQTVINAIEHDTNNIRHWIEQVYGGGHVYTWEQVLRAARHIDHFWNDPIADVILPLVAEVYQQGATVIGVNGSVTNVRGGGRVLVRVQQPFAHYHATR